MMDEIYLLYSCDEWKSKDSMRLIMATTDFDNIIEELKTRVSCGDMSCEGHEFDELEDAHDFNKAIIYGYIQTVGDGGTL